MATVGMSSGEGPWALDHHRCDAIGQLAPSGRSRWAGWTEEVAPAVLVGARSTGAFADGGRHAYAPGIVPALSRP